MTKYYLRHYRCLHFTPKQMEKENTGLIIANSSLFRKTSITLMQFRRYELQRAYRANSSLWEEENYSLILLLCSTAKCKQRASILKEKTYDGKEFWHTR